MAKKDKDKKVVKKSVPVALFKKYQTFCLVIFFGSFLLFSNTLGHDYAFDDSVAITANEFTKKGIDGIPDLLTKDLFAGIYGQSLDIGGGRWRPLSLITFAIEWEIMGGPSPGFSHFINVLLFSFSMVLLFLTLIRLTGYPLFAFLVTLLFLVHPLHSEVIANIKSRDEIFSLLFITASIWFLLSDEKRAVLKACVCYALALLSKENGILFLVLIPFLLLVFRKSPLKTALRTSVPIFIVGIVYLLIRASLVGSVGDKASADIMENHLFGAGFGERTATVAYIFFQYLKLFFFPHPLSSDYSFNQTPVVGWSDPFAILSLLVHLSLIIFAFLSLKKYFSSDKKEAGLKEIISFGIIYYLIHLSLVSNLLFNIGAPMGERFTYLASLGACMAVVALLLLVLKVDAKSEASWAAKPSLIILALCLPLAGKTFVRNADWKNNETLFVADSQHAPNSAKAHYYLGNSLFNQAVEDKTSPEFNSILLRSKSSLYRALEIHPGFHHAWNKLGMIYNELKNPDSAVYCLEKVLVTIPENVNLSAKDKKKVQTLDKTGVDALATLGAVYGQQKNDLVKSIYYLTESLRYNPNNLPALQNLGIAYAMKGETQNAISTFEKAVNLDPNNGTTYVNIGKLYGNAGNTQKMEEYFAKARSLGVEPK